MARMRIVTPSRRTRRAERYRHGERIDMRRTLRGSLRTAGDPTALFYALLMQSRHGLGVPPTPTRPSSELPESVHEAYETAIRSADAPGL